ncbi:hypothetical protein WR25_03846 [Diploscapter pachys]|uniref:Major facilitator superfamily (MFS) profile domain-containing protein n=1 Tax=Diploscapter pachys TaxID=2018661 RepID=A0A2A2JMK2_9BILA|nr:hypothetical protein WR25_03846 [Diploscapter pachys]
MQQVADSVFPTQAAARAQYQQIFGTRTRFVMMFLVLLCLTSIWSNILTFNIAVICMGPEENGTAEHNEDSHIFTNNQRSIAISVVAVAALICNIPAVALVNKVGIRTVFGGLGLLSAVATLLIPVSIRMGYTYFYIVRVFQGIAFAANFPVIGAFTANWAYFKQSGLFVAALVAYVQLSPAITMPVSGALCEAWRWPSIFYCHGAVTLFLFVFYGLFYRNNPSKHPFVGEKEWKKISSGKVTGVDKKALRKVPYMAILKTPVVWAVWIASIGNFTLVNLLFHYSPVYLSQVLGFGVHSTGFSAALPPLAQFILKILGGFISDKIHCIPEARKFRIFNTIAFGGAIVFLVILVCIGISNRFLSMLALGGSAGCLGFATGGFFKAGPVLSRQYSHFVTGMFAMFLTGTMILVPVLVNVVVTHNSYSEWNIVFIVTAVILFITNIVFCVFVKGEPCEWTHDRWLSQHTAKVHDIATVEGQTQPQTQQKF